MQWFWTTIAPGQVALLAAYAVWAASADYFVKMPASVSRGTSVTALVASRVVWLALVMAAVASVAVFVVACALLAIFVVFSMPQY
jgi:hypothetical protein